MTSSYFTDIERCAAQGMTKAQTAALLHISRQTVYDVSKAHQITWTKTAGKHLHGPGKRPQYRRGCPGCQEYMREWAASHRKESNGNQDPEQDV